MERALLTIHIGKTGGKTGGKAGGADGKSQKSHSAKAGLQVRGQLSKNEHKHMHLSRARQKLVANLARDFWRYDETRMIISEAHRLRSPATRYPKAAQSTFRTLTNIHSPRSFPAVASSVSSNRRPRTKCASAPKQPSTSPPSSST